MTEKPHKTSDLIMVPDDEALEAVTVHECPECATKPGLPCATLGFPAPAMDYVHQARIDLATGDAS